MTILSNILSGLVLVATLVTPVVEGVCRIVSLSGGGSHGAFEAGVLQKLVEEPTWQPWDVHAGVSAGSLNIIGLLKDDYKTNLDTMHSLWANTKTSDIVELLVSQNSISGNQKIRKLINSAYGSMSGVSQTGGKSFHVGVTNLYTGAFVSLEVDPAKPNLEYILASTSIPVFFPPSAISPIEVYVDGGLQKNEMFLSTLQYCDSSETEFVIDMIFANREVEETKSKNWTLMNIALRSLELIANNFNNVYFKTISSCKIQKPRRTNVLVNTYMPPFDINIGTLDFDHGEYLWQLGYNNLTKETFYC